MQRRQRSLSLLAFLLGVLSQTAHPALGQSKDAIIGTWVMDRAKSDFNPDNDILRSRTIVFEAIDNGVKCTITSVIERGNGRTTDDSTYTAHYDSKDVPIDSSMLSTVALNRVDANTFERTGKIQGKAVETATMKISADKKVLTITTMGNINGTDYSSTQIYDRQ